MLHTNLQGNRSSSSEKKKIFKGFLLYGRGGHLGHVTSIIYIKFHFLVPESLHKKIGKNGSVVSEKTSFNYHR